MKILLSLLSLFSIILAEEENVQSDVFPLKISPFWIRPEIGSFKAEKISLWVEERHHIAFNVFHDGKNSDKYELKRVDAKLYYPGQLDKHVQVFMGNFINRVVEPDDQITFRYFFSLPARAVNQNFIIQFEMEYMHNDIKKKQMIYSQSMTLIDKPELPIFDYSVIILIKFFILLMSFGVYHQFFKDKKEETSEKIDKKKK